METSVGPTAVEYLLIGEFLSAPEAILEVDSYSSAVSIVLPALVAWNASQTLHDEPSALLQVPRSQSHYDVRARAPSCA